MEVPFKTKNAITTRSSNLTPRIYQEKTKSLLWKDTCTSVFIAALFTVVKTWKQVKCTLVDEWIKMEYNSVIKKNEIMPSAATSVDAEIVTLSEVSQTEKDKYRTMSLICEIFKKWYEWTHLQNRSRLTDIENKVMVRKEKWRGMYKCGTEINRCIHSLLLFSHYIVPDYIKNK